MSKPGQVASSQVFYLCDRHRTIYGTVFVPDPTTEQVVSAAWSYAMQYSAKGLDLPDYEAAIKLLLERHPTWLFSVGNPQAAYYRPNLSDQDKPDV